MTRLTFATEVFADRRNDYWRLGNGTGSTSAAEPPVAAPLPASGARLSDTLIRMLENSLRADRSHVEHEVEISYHQAATVAGLARTFSAQEIGAIYASSWERDFSQGHADIASAAIAWTAVKNHAAQHNGDPGPAAAAFQAAVWKLVNDDLIDIIRGESLGNYQPWEHMDAPDDPQVREAADEHWAGKASGVAGYLMDSKAHIKDQLVAAIDVYRMLHDADPVGGSIDNWQDTAKPAGYVKLTTWRRRTTRSVYMDIAHLLPVTYNDTSVARRDPIKEHTSALVEEQAAKQVDASATTTGPAYIAALWDPVARRLGRAMHAFEDFWAHSNWLELAKLTYVRTTLGDNAPPLLQGWVAANQDLKTGSFDMPAKVHTLSHQLLALVRGFQHDFDLLLEVYGRTQASTKLDDEGAKLKRRTASGGDGDSDHARVYEPLATDSWSAISALLDVFIAASNALELVRLGKYNMEDFLCNRAWLAALESKSKLLLEQGNDHSGVHGTLAVHPDEDDKDRRDRMVIATAANELVFGPLRAIMDEADPAKALAAIENQLGLIDAMVQAPSPSHPLWSHVVAAIETH